MKRYLTKTILFLSLIAVVLALSEGVVRHYPNSYRFKHEWMEANAPKVKTLILGNSHTYYAVMPALLSDSTFSLANVSQTPEYDYWLLEKYIDRTPNLKTVIMAADEINLFDPEIEEGVEWHRSIYYNVYMDYPKHAFNPKYSFELSSIETFNMKLQPAIKYLFTGKTHVDCDSTGFGCNYATPKAFNQTWMTSNAKKIYNSNKDSHAIEYNAAYLYKIASLCHKRGIRLVLVTTPVWAEYMKLFDKHRFDEIHETAARCVNKYGAEYHDYMNDTRFNGTDFYDGGHLSQQGAEKFTAILKEELQQL